MAEHLQNKDFRVSGHLEDKRGIYQIILSWKTSDGTRGRQSVSTGLPIKGNKKRAEDMLQEAKKKKKAELESEIGKSPDINSLLFADYLEQWVEAVKDDIALTTYGGYSMNIKSVIGPYFREKEILLCELTPDHLNEFYREQKKRVKMQTVQHYHANISNALNYAVENNILEYSIMSTGKVKRPVVPKAQRFVGQFLKQSEAIEVFDKVRGHKLELGVILAAYYGLRRSEVVGLRWESIDFDANTITIEHTVTSTTIDGKTVIIAGDTTKSESSYRSLPLVSAFRETLLNVKAEQDHNRKLCGRSFNKVESRYVYTDQLGNRIRPNYLTTAFPEWMEKNGFKRLRFHDLRHSCASLLLASGVPLKQIQEWLGHSNFAITADLYAHLDAGSKIASAEKMLWINETAMAQNIPVETEQGAMGANATTENWNDILHELLITGVSTDTLQAWLKQCKVTGPSDLREDFKAFMQSTNKGFVGNENCQPV